jgi:hypothetical protein
MAQEEGFKINSYNSDNRIFAATEFKDHCNCHQMKYSFSGVGAKHQNGIAEHSIKTIAQWACANMLHLATSWLQCADSKYWPQAIDYATWVFNKLPNMESRISPDELRSGVRRNDRILQHAHVFGCPVYVLDAALQDGKKIPKWNPWERLGLFLGFSDLHSSQEPLVLNIESGHISPQFHVIYDDEFETVHSLPSNQPLDHQWAKIFSLGRECFADMDYNENDQPILPPLSGIIRTFREERITQPSPEPITPVDFNPIFDKQYGNKKDAIPDKHQHNPDDIIPVPGGALNEMTQADPLHAMNIPGGAPTTIPSKADIPFLHPIPIPGGDTRNFPTGENINENENQGDNGFTSSGRPHQNVGTYKDSPAITHHLLIDN